MGPLGHQGQAMDVLIFEEWDECPHCVKDSHIHRTGQGNPYHHKKHCEFSAFDV
jgi:hypothetical protein